MQRISCSQYNFEYFLKHLTGLNFIVVRRLLLVMGITIYPEIKPSKFLKKIVFSNNFNYFRPIISKRRVKIMASLLNNVNKKEIMKWAALLPFFMILFLSFSRRQGTQVTLPYNVPASSESNQPSLTSKSVNDWSFFYEICELFENELDEDNENQVPADELIFESSFSLFPNDSNRSTCDSKYGHSRNTKLFILFHSWKSYLFV